MVITIDQQMAMDEALIPTAQRLKIGRSNFRLLSDIKSKESTLQLVYDVLRICLFFKTFLVTAHVPEIYMQEFWATSNVHHHAIRFKMDNKKHIVNLESFRDILHICPRVHGQAFDELLFEEEILAFIHFLGHSAAIRTLTDVNINKLYQPWRSFDDIINKCLTGKSSGNSKAYKEYYAIATGEAAPKPKASVRRTKSSSDTSITPPTTAASLRLIAFAKGKQPAKASKAKSLSALSEVAMTEAQQLKLVTKRSRQQMHISQPSGSGADEETGSKPGVPDVPTDESEEEFSWNSTNDKGDENEEKDDDSDEEDEGNDGQEGNGDDDEDDDGKEGNDDDADQDVVRDDDKDDDEEGGDEEHESDEETRDKESFDPIPQTLESSDDEEAQGLNISEKERHVEEEEKDELIETQTNQFARAVSSIRGIVNHYMDQRMNEVVKVAVQIQSHETQRENDKFLGTVDENIKKIIKEQVKEQVKVQVSKILPRIKQAVNKQLEAEVLTRSSHSSRTSYAVAADLSEMELKKILIEKIEGNKETVTLKRRRDNDADKDEEPSAGPDRGSKRRKEGKEPESASAPTKTATRSAGSVDTLTPELLAGPTYDLMKGSCKSLIELEYHLEEVYKATKDQLDWVNPEVLWFCPRDVYSKRRIIAVTELKIIEWHSYKHLDWITVRRDDGKLYKFKEGYFKRLCIQDIKDMLLLLVQGKLTNLTVEERFAFNNRLNLTKPNSYQFDLKRKEAYTAYSNLRGFIYQNKDKRNRLMRIDELHKFSDGTLTDVRTALDDRLKGIQM
uniref:Uncharacterized protein n=1 Tax=Tanacetum cinerariifolium TaxID=118510 RepID=A0A699GN03_TANCI|nr:hypothetical protein [Tanacetum cinerariifolium]